MGLTFHEVLEEKLDEINEQKKYELPYLLNNALYEDGIVEIEIVESYPPAFAPNEMQITGEYDGSMTEVPILRSAAVKIPPLFLKKFQDNTFVITVIPDTTPEEGLPKSYFRTKNYRPQRFVANNLECGIAEISREPKDVFPNGVLYESETDHEEFRRTINGEGWLRGTDKIRISVMRGKKYCPLLTPSYVDTIVRSQYLTMVRTLHEASKIHPKKNYGN